MTVYLAAASFADVNPLKEDGSAGSITGGMRTGNLLPSTYPDRTNLRFTLDTQYRAQQYYDFLAAETPVPVDATPKWVHFWWNLRTDGLGDDSPQAADAFALYCSDGTRLLNFSNTTSGVHLRVYDNTGATVFSDLTTDYVGRNEYGSNEINIKITGGSPGNVKVFENQVVIADVDVPNINTDFARVRMGQPDDYGDENYFQEILIADFDTRGARVKNITLSAATTDTTNVNTVEANARDYLGSHATYANRTGIVFDTDGQKILYPSDGGYVKDTATAIKEVRLRSFSLAETGTAVPNLIPLVEIGGVEYPQTPISPVVGSSGMNDPLVFTSSPATSTDWTEAELQGISLGIEAEV